MSIKLTVRAAFITAALTGLACTMTTPGHAGGVGMLTCQHPQATGYIIVSTQVFDCAFTPSAGGPAQYYRATISRFGAEVGTSSNTTLLWAVFALGPVSPGALAGGYGGVSAGAAVGLGVRANALVGGLPNSFALQPLSVEGENGLGVTATVTGLWLNSAVRQGRHHRRYQRYRS
jgi:hypothetical protein